MTCATPQREVLYFDIGDPVKLEGSSVLASSGAGYDSTVVRMRITDPLGVITVYVYGVDAELTRVTDGSYLLIIRPTVAGLFKARYESEDSGSDARYGADEWHFIVRRSAFYEPTGTPSVGSGGSAGFDGGTP